MTTTLSVKIGPNSWPVTLPDFVVRQELTTAWVECGEDYMALRRVCAAAVGLCTRVGKLSRADYARHNCNVRSYGGAVYNYLHDQGESLETVMRAGYAILAHIAEQMSPSKEEVDGRVGFTDPAAADSTGT